MKRIFACAVLLVLIQGHGQSEPRQAASGTKQEASTYQKAAPPDASEYVGAETCETCHSDIAKKFNTNPHSHLALMHSGKGVTCESCHGAGKAHVESSGDVTKILQFSKASARLINT